MLDVVESVGTAVVCLLLVLLTGDSVVDEQRNTTSHATTTSTSQPRSQEMSSLFIEKQLQLLVPNDHIRTGEYPFTIY